MIVDCKILLFYSEFVQIFRKYIGTSGCSASYIVISKHKLRNFSQMFESLKADTHTRLRPLTRTQCSCHKPTALTLQPSADYIQVVADDTSFRW
jgi:hypothetical protein